VVKTGDCRASLAMIPPLYCYRSRDSSLTLGTGSAISATRIGRPSFQLTGENIAPILLLMYHSPVLWGDEIMKTFNKGAIRDEKGQVLILALVLLVVGGLILTPLLGLMSTGLLAGQVYEKKMDELYAADAGVEDAIWRIKTNNLTFVNNYSSEPWHLTVNNRSVDVVVYREDLDPTCAKNFTYQIISTAATDDGGGTAAIGSGTQIEAYVTAVVKSSGILDHVITSPCGYNVSGGQSQINPPEGEHGPEGNYVGAWPTAEMLSELYWEDVGNVTQYGSDTIDLEGVNMTLGPLYRNGTLTITNSGPTEATLTLNGTLYITRDTFINGQGNKVLYLNLNGNTIFVEDATGAAPEDDPCNPEDNKYALKIGSKCTLTGSGCIIAVGNIEFKPNLSCSEEDYILVLSVSGKTYMQPNGDFYGTLAGNAEVYIQNGDATWTDYSAVEGGLNFPDLPGTQQISSYNIASWEISAV